MKIGYLRSKTTGNVITGEVDRVIAYANISHVTQAPDGTIDHEWSGESDVDWDSQRADLDRKGQIQYVDGDGNWVPASDVEFVEGDPDDDDDDDQADDDQAAESAE
jgi:hypothetical protein